MRLETFRLVCHPDTPARDINGVEAWLDVNGANFAISFHVHGAHPKMPAPGKAERADGLWQTTCFELFVRPCGNEAYLEFNFAPSGRWAAYRFDGYRSGMADLSVTAPRIEPIESGIRACGELDVAAGAESCFALSAVIEEVDGTRSYWALAHPPGAPDFHHPACFAASLPAPRNP